MTKRFVFKFINSHYDPSDTEEVVYFFMLEGSEKLFTEFSTDDEDYLLFVGLMESYGVHDFGTTGAEEYLGYHSYEIEKKNWQKVVQKWHDYMTACGFTAGTIQILSQENYNDLYFS